MCSLYMCSLNKLGRPSGQKKVPIKKKRHLSEPSEVRVTDDVGRSFGEAITCVKMCVYVRERERERERKKDDVQYYNIYITYIYDDIHVI